jgi:hypothetical protein
LTDGSNMKQRMGMRRAISRQPCRSDLTPEKWT